MRALKTACDERSIPHLTRVFTRDAALLVDTGGHVPGPTREVRGDAAIAAVLIGMLSIHHDVSLAAAEINALPGLVMRSGDRVVGVMSAMVGGRGISELWVVVNPEKLRHWN